MCLTIGFYLIAFISGGMKSLGLKERFAKVSFALKKKFENYKKVFTRVLADQRLYNYSDEPNLKQHDPETRYAAHVNILGMTGKKGFENATICDLLKNEAFLKWVEVLQSSSQDDTLLSISENFKEVRFGRLISPDNSRANVTMPYTAESEAICRTERIVTESSADFKSLLTCPVGDIVLVENHANLKSASEKPTLLRRMEMITISYKGNNCLMNSACHDGNENGDTGKSSATSQQTQCQNTNATGASYEQALGNRGMAALPGGSQDGDDGGENPRKPKKHERIGGCASSESGQSDKKRNTDPNNNRPERDQQMPDQSLPYGECSEVPQGAAEYQRPQLQQPFRARSDAEEEDIPVEDANWCEDHKEVLNDDNMQLEVLLNRQPKDIFDPQIYQDDNLLRLPLGNDPGTSHKPGRESNIDCRTGQKVSPPPDARQGDGRQIPPPDVSLGQTSVQPVPNSHDPTGHLDPSSPPVLLHSQLEDSQDINPAEEQIPPSSRTPFQHAPISHEAPRRLDPPSSPVLPHRQVDNPHQGSHSSKGFFSQDGEMVEGVYPEQIDSRDSVAAEFSSFQPRRLFSTSWARSASSSEINQAMLTSRRDEERLNRTFDSPPEIARRTLWHCFDCNNPHLTSGVPDGVCDECGRFFCLDHWQRHDCVPHWFVEEEDFVVESDAGERGVSSAPWRRFL